MEGWLGNLLMTLLDGIFGVLQHCAMHLRSLLMLCCITSAALAQASFRGVYVGNVFVGGQKTDSVLLVNVLSNSQAVGLVYDYASRSFFEVPNAPLSPAGGFSFIAGTTQFTGQIQNGRLTGTGSPGGIIITGTKSPTVGPAQAFAGTFPGWLVTPTTILDHGLIITADGLILTYARTGPTTSDGASGLIGSTGDFTLRFVGGNTATGRAVPIAGTPTLTGSYLRGTTSYDFIGGRESAVNDLVNISTRGFVGTGASVMIAGFVIEPKAKTVFIRALGPTLTLFGVSDVLSDPRIDLYRGATLLTSNDDWQTSTEAAAIGDRPDRPNDPREPALLVTLEPGAYTVILSGKGTATGNALIEVNKVE